jgi:hypothetical protein
MAKPNAFRRPQPRTPGHLAGFTILLHVDEDQLGSQQSLLTVNLRCRLEIIDSQGQVLERQGGDLRDELTPDQADRLEVIARALYAKAKAAALAP